MSLYIISAKPQSLQVLFDALHDDFGSLAAELQPFFRATCFFRLENSVELML